MKKVGYVFHPDYLMHTDSGYHPENPQRLKVIDRAITESGLGDKLVLIEPHPATPEQIMLNHTESHYKAVKKTQTIAFGNLDLDTFFCSDSYQAAMLAAGGAISAGELLMEGEINSAFCALRPPGHHAEPDHTKGFCLFNNIAILAYWLINEYKLNRIAILDWDVHHGNGTQKSFYDTDKVHFTSLHQYPFYPGSGSNTETGTGKGKGYTLNIPLSAGISDTVFLDAIRDDWYNAMYVYNPEIILVSTGYDAHIDDPLAFLDISDKAFTECTKIAKDVSERFCQGRIITILEGGYNLDVLKRNVINLINILME